MGQGREPTLLERQLCPRPGLEAWSTVGPLHLHGNFEIQVRKGIPERQTLTSSLALKGDGPRIKPCPSGSKPGDGFACKKKKKKKISCYSCLLILHGRAAWNGYLGMTRGGGGQPRGGAGLSPPPAEEREQCWHLEPRTQGIWRPEARHPRRAGSPAEARAPPDPASRVFTKPLQSRSAQQPEPNLSLC